MGKPKKPRRRQNRYKKTRSRKGPGLLRRALLIAKLSGLIIILLAVSALFMLGYAAVTQSDYFRTRSIVVEGLSRLSREAVLVQAGFYPGDNLLAINLHLVRKRLLGHPWIAAARVAREIPETISIHIEEHVPLAVVDLGRRFLVNTQGRIFKELGSQDPGHLPVIHGIRYTDISLGGDALGPAMQAVRQVLALSRQAKEPFAYGQIARLEYDPELGIGLISRQDRRACLLGHAPYEAKFKRLARLTPRLQRNRRWQEYQTIDLNNPDRIVVQLDSTRTPKGNG